MMVIKSVQYEKGKPEDLPQIAFVGRSNVGKSSLLNFISGRKIAIASSTPGRTKRVNFFRVDTSNTSNMGSFYFVDLPGYGFSQSKIEGEDVEKFLFESRQIALVFVLLDIRHAPSGNDIVMLNFLQTNSIPFSIIATKCDKLSNSQLCIAHKKMAENLGIGVADIVLSSSSRGRGRESLLLKITEALGK